MSHSSDVTLNDWDVFSRSNERTASTQAHLTSITMALQQRADPLLGWDEIGTIYDLLCACTKTVGRSVAAVYPKSSTLNPSKPLIRDQG